MRCSSACLIWIWTRIYRKQLEAALANLSDPYFLFGKVKKGVRSKVSMCWLSKNVCMLHFIFSSLCFNLLFYVSGVVFKYSPTYPWIISCWYSSVFYYLSYIFFCSKHWNIYFHKRTTINLVHLPMPEITPNYMPYYCCILSIKVRKMGHCSNIWNRPLKNSNSQYYNYNWLSKWNYIPPCSIFCVHTSRRRDGGGTAWCDIIVHREENRTGRNIVSFA